MLPDFQLLHEKEVKWVGVDRGVHTLFTIGIQPMIAFGDFDSVSEKEFLVIKNQLLNLKCSNQKKMKPIWNMHSIGQSSKNQK